MKAKILFAALWILLLSQVSFAQTLIPLEDEWTCGFSEEQNNQPEIGSIPQMIDTSLKVGILLVQFADWETNSDARGGVGWNSWDTSIAVMDTFKYGYYPSPSWGYWQC